MTAQQNTQQSTTQLPREGQTVQTPDGTGIFLGAGVVFVRGSTTETIGTFASVLLDGGTRRMYDLDAVRVQS